MFVGVEVYVRCLRGVHIVSGPMIACVHLGLCVSA